MDNLLRIRKGHEHARVTFVELFFDLVFVFAVTQLSHTLLAHYSALGAIETLLLLMAVWWVWIYTSWVTNWLDPERIPVRLMLFAIMLAGLILSSSLPKAFAELGLVFALAHVTIQIGRTLFTIWAARGNVAIVRNFQRILFWLCGSGILWIAGGFADGEMRLVFWIVALAIEYAGPSMGFWTPGMGCSTTADWDVEGGHLSERCGLFVIIALGESILVTGATFSNLAWSWPVVLGFLSAFVASLAMWWIYFNTGAERGTESITTSGDPGRLARLGYTYIHLFIVAGIIVTAVGDEFTLVHPDGHADLKMASAIVGGPLLYLIGTLLFRRAITGQLPKIQITALAALIAVFFAAGYLTPAMLSLATTLVLVVVALAEKGAAREMGGEIA
ncbi:low temperature requirement protein A [Aestuariivirga sp. YIM B02566]|uniref:low temperature requirement protein A n=1 Tax=Taklimakanibacter albus TaxID=2800327 RepID=UPI001FED6B80|nr:low temperature requirement protein A [Aestuariivirga sp. YIM B02566]